MTLKHLITIVFTLASISLLPSVSFAQIWQGLSLSLTQGSYSSDGTFIREADFHDEKTNIRDTYKTKGSGYGLDLGYQFVLGKITSLYLFSDSISGNSNVEIKGSQYQKSLGYLSYTSRAFGVEGRCWKGAFYGGVGVAFTQEKFARKNNTDEIFSLLPGTTNIELITFPVLGYENYSYNLSTRLSIRSVSNFSEDAMVGSATVTMLSIGYRWENRS